MIGVSLIAIARALGGEVAGRQVLSPGPNHDRHDRSLSIKLSASSPDGFITHSFAGDSFQECRDHVKARLGIVRAEAPAARAPASRIPETSEGSDETRRIERAQQVWRDAVDPRGTIVEGYLRNRALDLPDDVAGSVLRFHPSCPWRDKDSDRTIYVPAMVAAIRSIAINKIIGVHRTRLSPNGVKLDRRMLGFAAGGAIKLDADDTVGSGLHVAEGIETALAARQFGIRPTWALGSTSFVAAFPVLAGIECLTLLAENDAASAKAVQACAQRWHHAGCEVLINRSRHGKDLNDAIRGAA